MDIIAEPDAAPEAFPVAAAAGPAAAADRKYAVELIGTFIFLSTIGAKVDHWVPRGTGRL